MVSCASWGKTCRFRPWAWAAWECRFYGPGDDAESIATIHRAIDLGMWFLDTADMYGTGRNEELVGRALRGRRGEVVLATKFGNVRGPNGEFLSINGRPDYVRQACEASLNDWGRT